MLRGVKNNPSFDGTLRDIREDLFQTDDQLSPDDSRVYKRANFINPGIGVLVASRTRRSARALVELYDVTMRRQALIRLASLRPGALQRLPTDDRQRDVYRLLPEPVWTVRGAVAAGGDWIPYQAIDSDWRDDDPDHRFATLTADDARDSDTRSIRDELRALPSGSSSWYTRPYTDLVIEKLCLQLYGAGMIRLAGSVDGRYIPGLHQPDWPPLRRSSTTIVALAKARLLGEQIAFAAASLVENNDIARMLLPISRRARVRTHVA